MRRIKLVDVRKAENVVNRHLEDSPYTIRTKGEYGKLSIVAMKRGSDHRTIGFGLTKREAFDQLHAMATMAWMVQDSWD